MLCPNSDPNFDKMLSNFIDITKDYPKKENKFFILFVL